MGAKKFESEVSATRLPSLVKTRNVPFVTVTRCAVPAATVGLGGLTLSKGTASKLCVARSVMGAASAATPLRAPIHRSYVASDGTAFIGGTGVVQA